MAEVLNTEYVLSGVKLEGYRVFCASDSGYPYWTTNIRSAKFSPSAVEASSKNNLYGNMKSEVIKLEVLQIDIVATVLSTEDVVSEAKAFALKEMAEIQRKLEEKTAQVQAML